MINELRNYMRMNNPERHLISRIRWGLLFMLFYFQNDLLKAQDTTRSQTIQIISNYKPVLRSATKLSFSASPLPPAPFSDKFRYTLPDQQFKVIMKPVELVPATFQPDSIKFTNHHFLKLGYGNFQRIYADAGTTWGTGKPLQFQLMAGYHSLNGDLLFQQHQRIYADASAQVFRNNHRFNTKASFGQRNYYFFGADSVNINAKQDSLRQTFNLFSVEVDLSNNEPGQFGLHYRPAIKTSLFSDRNSTEWNLLFRLPISVRIGNQLLFSFQANADLTGYRPKDTLAYTNHIVSFYPSVAFPFRDFKFDLGGQLAWDQGTLKFLPQMGIEAFVHSNRAIIMAGWKSSIRKNNYQQLTELNPWICQPMAQFNTRIDEVFAGLRGDLPRNIHYRFRAGVTNFHSQPLFVNVKQLSVFDILYEKSLQTLHVNAAAEWLRSEKISTGFSLDYYQFIRQKEADKPWHFVPLELNFSVRWKPLPQLIVQSRIYAWQGAYALKDTLGAYKKLSSVVDANLEADYRLSKFFTVWLQINNLFNQAYERWNRYPVVGFQVVGGIRLNFVQNK